MDGFKKRPILDNYASVQAHVILGKTRESEILEFKEMLPLKNSTDYNKSVAKDFCAFANKWGGTILIGVKEGRDEGSPDYAKEFTGVENPSEYRRYFLEVLPSFLHPRRVIPNPVEIALGEGKFLIALNIEPLVNDVAIVFHPSTEDIMSFVYRGDRGNKSFLPHELEKHMNNTSRQTVINLANLGPFPREVHVQSPICQVRSDGHFWSTAVGRITIEAILDSYLILILGDRVVHLPYSLIEHYWLTVDNKIGLIVGGQLMIPIDKNKMIWVKTWRSGAES